VSALQARGIEALVAIGATQPHRPYDFRPPPDPKLARQLVENRVKIPAIQEGGAAFTLSTVENNNLLSGLKLRLADQEKQAK
jgi:hypothetical protein